MVLILVVTQTMILEDVKLESIWDSFLTVKAEEDEFVTSEYPLEWMDRISDYEKTKRNAERAVLEFMDPLACTFVRYPVVLGENDYTKRLNFYIEHIKNDQPMYVDDLDEAMAFIHEKEAGEFIAYLADHPFSGPVNGCSNGAIKISDIISYAEKNLVKRQFLMKMESLHHSMVLRIL